MGWITAANGARIKSEWLDEWAAKKAGLAKDSAEKAGLRSGYALSEKLAEMAEALGRNQAAEAYAMAGDERIAVMGDPDPTRMDAPIPVHYRDRWAGKPWDELAEEALGLLRDEKGLDAVVAWKRAGGDGTLLSYAVCRNHALTEVTLLLKPEIFDRTHETPLDGYARLPSRLDTHDYIVLRIAYVLLQAYKIGDRDAMRIDLPEVKILKHVTAPDF